MAIYHKLNLALCGMVPAALVLSPSMINFPIDLAMGFAIPVHFLIGGHGVVTDYAQKIIKAKWFENGLRVGLLGLALASAAMSAEQHSVNEGACAATPTTIPVRVERRQLDLLPPSSSDSAARSLRARARR